MSEDVMNEFDAVNAWTCKHCGELVQADLSELEIHLDECERYETK